ncbi:hypothetical protein PCANC_08974 [Puccinia coronata f. sp. avenae]|uniref:Ras GEF n=1 Tax=Puccinia coronata f. sp. avenae TaxID=200324 RepID=A0A2N5VHQ5_9BASI|nr:hypothetical protein PCANC_08974 [Puccinia coronata f. sp. avenae]
MSPIPGSPASGTSFPGINKSPVLPSSPSTAAHDFVLALYDFPATAPSTHRCLSFKAGQVIRVVNRDKSGWWDGEMIASDSLSTPPSPDSHPTIQRGWFPSNYVNPIPNKNIAGLKINQNSSQSDSRRPSYVSSSNTTTNEVLFLSPALSLKSTSADVKIPSRPRTGSSSTVASQRQPSVSDPNHPSRIWEPIAQAIRNLHLQVDVDPSFDVQPPTIKIISSVRAALDSTGCLGRNAPALALYPNLSRARKQLLCSLSSLVDLARETAPAPSPSLPPPPSQQEAKQNILQHADQVLSHVREFLRIAHRYGVTAKTQGSSSKLAESLMMSSGQRSMSLSSSNQPHSPEAPKMVRPSKSVGTLVKFTPHEPTESVPPVNPIIVNRRRLDSIHSARSISSNPSSAIITPVSTSQILQMVVKAHGRVLSTVAVLVGHAHIHSSTAHPASHAYLIDMTRDVIDNVCEVLTLVESITKNSQVRDQQPFQNESPLSQARESLYLATTHLVTSTRVATSTSPLTSPPLTAAEDEEAGTLLSSATAVLRATHSCMDAVSDCLAAMDPTYGDFEVSSHRPSVITSYFGKEFAERSRHAMPGRKMNPLAFISSPSESENHSCCGAVPQDWNNPSTRDGRSTALSIASQHGYLYSPDSSSMAPSKSSANKGKGSQATSSTSPTSLSTLSSSDGIECPRASPSTANSSEGRSSLESSPATSASVLHHEDDSAQQHTVVAKSSKRKPLTLHIPARTVVSQNPDTWQKELLFNSDGHVIGGTLRGLVGRMTSHDTPVEATFSHAFFMTFRLFTTPAEFSDALIARFSLTFELNTPVTPGDPSNRNGKFTPIRLRVYNVMKSWLELHWRMETDDAVLPSISRWTETQLSTALPVPAERLIDLVQKRIKEKELGIHHEGLQTRTKVKKQLNSSRDEHFKMSCPAPIISKAMMTQLRSNSFHHAAIQLIDFDPIELARQITIMESKLYQAIKPEEVIGQLFNKKAGLAVNVRAMSAMSTKMTGWFTETILAEDDIRKRTHTLKFLIKLGFKLLEMQNYNALMSVMSALNSSTILRLKRTWEGLGNKARMLFDTMNNAVSHQRNYAKYRAALRQAQTPCIPFLGVYLTDMTFCHEGNPNYRSSPHLPGVQLINFDKYQKMTKIMNELERFQAPFHFVEVPKIAAYIRHSMDNLSSSQDSSANDLYQRSLQIEPREPSSVAHAPSLPLPPSAA